MNLAKHWAAALDDYVIDLAWSPDGTMLAAASAAGPVHLLAAADGGTRHALPGHENGTNAVAFAPANKQPSTSNVQLLATGGQDGAVKFWDATAGQHTETQLIARGSVDCIAWKPGGVKILAAACGRTLASLLPEATQGNCSTETPKTISALAWQAGEGGQIAAAYFGGVSIWPKEDFASPKILPYANGILALVWSPDGRWLVSGNQDPSVHLWLPEKNDELQMSGYESKVPALAFDRSSRWLATAGGHDASVWDCAGAGPEGRAPQMLPHEAKVCAVAFQNAHGLLATASVDGVVMLWSPERPQPLRATVRLPAPVTKLAWTPDDRLLALGTEHGAVHVLRCEA
jgi:WD40 repeat protein